MELCLVVDHACNLRCRYCYGGRKYSRPMSVATMQTAVDLALAKAKGWLSITFFGGEPLLRLPFLQATERYVAEAERAGRARVKLVRWLVDTNGTLIDDAAADWLGHLPQAKVFVSLDGGADVHDLHRRDVDDRGSHATVVAAIARLRQRRIPFDLVAVVTPETADAMGGSLAFLSALGAEQISFQIDYRSTWDKPALGQLSAGLARAADRMIELFRAGQSAIVRPFHPKILSHITGGLPCPARCRLAAQEFAVAPSGRIYPCAEMIGEDRDEDSDEDGASRLSIGDVDGGVDEARALALRQSKDRVYQRCAACALRLRCEHHCGCRHLAVSGELGRLSGIYCEIETMIVDQADRVAETLWKESCPAFRALYYDQGWLPAPGAVL
jgi:uncharacterized protein